jgi:beta-ketodecanoyl-[acyl-carrier-protein] synthase
MSEIVLSGTGLFTPLETISNPELVASFNTYVKEANAQRPADDQLPESSAEFVVKASGIGHRYVMNKSGILDPHRMRPYFAPRPDNEISLQAEMALSASQQALENAGVGGQDVDAVLVACSNFQRSYPAIAVELQERLGAQGFAYDMNVACSSATFGIAQAVALVQSGAATRTLVVSPEICTAHLNFRDRDSHFIFGDACTAVVVEAAEGARSKEPYRVLGCKLATKFSNNIRNNRGFLTRCEDRPDDDPALLFYQEGRKVFRDVTLLVAAHLESHLKEHGLAPESLKSYWLHQANAAMNVLIARKLLGREASAEEAPLILDEYANTSSAGSVIAFHQHRGHLRPGDYGAICSFGAGYSIGSVIVEKL